MNFERMLRDVCVEIDYDMRSAAWDTAPEPKLPPPRTLHGLTEAVKAWWVAGPREEEFQRIRLATLRRRAEKTHAELAKIEAEIAKA